MTQIKTYKDLMVWQKSMDLVILVYNITKSFPKEESYGLIPQLRRCSVSIPSNIAEGFGRNSGKDFIRFLNIGMSSLFELQTQLEISSRIEYISKDSFEEAFEQSRELERMLSSLIQKLKNKNNS